MSVKSVVTLSTSIRISRMTKITIEIDDSKNEAAHILQLQSIAQSLSLSTETLTRALGAQPTKEVHMSDVIQKGIDDLKAIEVKQKALIELAVTHIQGEPARIAAAVAAATAGDAAALQALVAEMTTESDKLSAALNGTAVVADPQSI